MLYKNDQTSSPLGGLSPEEILAQKEMSGGLQYDDLAEVYEPIQTMEETWVQPITPASNKISDEEILREENRLNRERIERERLELLRSEKIEKELNRNSTFSPGMEYGWKNLPVSILPSKGLFYPDGTKIAIRPAEVKEIRHYSTIDENDDVDIDEKLNYILDKCSVINFPNGGVVSYRDLKQEDRFFIIMAIRDLTFNPGENRIIITPSTECNKKDECPFVNGIELRTGVLSDYAIDQNIMKYYSSESRDFIFTSSRINKTIRMSIPSIGVMEILSSFIRSKSKDGFDVSDDFLEISPFLFSEWRGLSDRLIEMKMEEMNEWTKEEFSLYFELSKKIKIGTRLDLSITCPNCGAEVTAPITFPGGIRSLLVISDIFGELL